MDVTLKIFRYNPEKDQKWHYETYTLEAEPTDRVLDLLGEGQGLSRWDTFFPPFVRARRVRLGCHAHQRPQYVGLQGAGQRCGQ